MCDPSGVVYSLQKLVPERPLNNHLTEHQRGLFPFRPTSNLKIMSKIQRMPKCLDFDSNIQQFSFVHGSIMEEPNHKKKKKKKKKDLKSNQHVLNYDVLRGKGTPNQNLASFVSKLSTLY